MWCGLADVCEELLARSLLRMGWGEKEAKKKENMNKKHTHNSTTIHVMIVDLEVYHSSVGSIFDVVGSVWLWARTRRGENDVWGWEIKRQGVSLKENC